MTYLVLGAVAAVLACVLTPVVRAFAIHLGAVDEPGARRVHAAPTPRLGGVALLAAGVGTLLIAPLLRVPAIDVLATSGWRLDWLLAGVLVTLATGVVDDTRGLTPLQKLGLQIVAGAMALAGGYGLVGATNPFSGAFIEFGPLAGVFTLLWILLITNALNLIDGLDGLAAGVAMIAAATLLTVSISEGRGDAACLWVIMLGALAGFLPYNFNPAKIFLGDSGSLLLGYLLAVLSIQSLQKGATAVVVLVPVLALGLPIMETLVTLLRRTIVSGIASIFRADREHIHHRLIASGMTQRRAVLSLYAVCVAFSALAFVAVVVQGAANAIIVAIGTVAVGAGIRALSACRQSAR